MMADRVLVSNVQPTDVQMGGMGDWDLFMSGRLGMIPTGIWAFQSLPMAVALIGISRLSLVRSKRPRTSSPTAW